MIQSSSALAAGGEVPDQVRAEKWVLGLMEQEGTSEMKTNPAKLSDTATSLSFEVAQLRAVCWGHHWSFHQGSEEPQLWMFLVLLLFCAPLAVSFARLGAHRLGKLPISAQSD